jgi:hypothetical protein
MPINLNEGGSVVQSFNLIGHSNGPGIAAVVVLNVLLDELVKKKVLDTGEVARILSIADARIESWGNSTAANDARKVLDKMRGVSS